MDRALSFLAAFAANVLKLHEMIPKLDPPSESPERPAADAGAPREGPSAALDGRTDTSAGSKRPRPAEGSSFPDLDDRSAPRMVAFNAASSTAGGSAEFRAGADKVALSDGGSGSWNRDCRNGEPVSTLATSAALAVRRARAFTFGCCERPPQSSERSGAVRAVPQGPAVRSDPTPPSRGWGDG